MKTAGKIALVIITLTALASANPLEMPFISEVSVSPPWIEVDCWDPDDLVGMTITTREGTATILSAEPTLHDLVVLDSSNTTGFYLHPDGDSIIISYEYERFCSRIGYGIYGDAAGVPPPGTSIESQIYEIWNGGDWGVECWYFSFNLEPSPGEYSIGGMAYPDWGNSYLIINEVCLNNSWRENANFVELYNAGSDPISLSSYRFIGDVVYSFPDDAIVSAGEFYTIEQINCPGLFNSINSDVLYLTRHEYGNGYSIVDQVGWDTPRIVNSGLVRCPDGDVNWSDDYDFRGYNTATSTTFENGFPTRGAANRHDCPGFVTIGVRVDSLDNSSAKISWTDPIWDAQFDYSVLVKSTDAYPATPNDGNIIYEGTAQEFIDQVIIPDVANYYAVFARNLSGEYSTPTGESQGNILFHAVGVKDVNLPEHINTLACYPNPFNAQTTICFSIANPGNVEIAIFDITGRLVETLAQRYYQAGSYSIIWDASRYSSGMYFARLVSDDISSIEKIVLLK